MIIVFFRLLFLVFLLFFIRICLFGRVCYAGIHSMDFFSERKLSCRTKREMIDRNDY
jgi:hypothetical protein